MSWRPALFGGLAVAACVPTPALAQEAGWDTVAVEVTAGIANFGHLLEQRFDGGERELSPGTTFAAGAAVSVFPYPKTWFRLGYTWAGGELEYRDDSGIDSDRLDLEDLSFLTANTLSLEVLQLLLGPEALLNPYALAGIAATLWKLEDDPPGVQVRPGDSDTLFRFGATAGFGVQLRPFDGLIFRAEVNNFALGNPFDGNNAYRAQEGVTFSEPEIVRMSRYGITVAYHFGI